MLTPRGARAAVEREVHARGRITIALLLRTLRGSYGLTDDRARAAIAAAIAHGRVEQDDQHRTPALRSAPTDRAALHPRDGGLCVAHGRVRDTNGVCAWCCRADLERPAA